MNTVLHETIDFSDPYKSFGDKKDLNIPVESYNP